MDFKNTQIILRDIFESEKDPLLALQSICDTLLTIDYYHWVGFYFMNNTTNTLHLGPFAGEPTDHIKIPFGKGICGQVALSGESFLVEDVSAQENYIACNLNTKSEIVVPLYANKKLVGQIDIDSEKANAFNQEDELFLKDLNAIIAVYFGNFLLRQQKELEANNN